jgi:hypothetical protein
LRWKWSGGTPHDFEKVRAEPLISGEKVDRELYIIMISK